MANKVEIPSFSSEELEAKAEEILRRVGPMGLYDNKALRIETLIDRMGFRVFPIQGLGRVAEAYIPIKESMIFVDEDQYNGVSGLRFRFSLAEEIAHSVIHRQLFADKTVAEIVQFQNDLTDDQYLQIEREAKRVAAALLMPKDSYKERFTHHSNTADQMPHSDLVKLKYVIKHLHYDFCVSKQAAALRAVFLGFIDWEEYQELMDNLAT